MPTKTEALQAGEDFSAYLEGPRPGLCLSACLSLTTKGTQERQTACTRN